MKLTSRMLGASLVLLALIPSTAGAAQTIEVRTVDKPPAIDGKADDEAWKSASAHTVRDKVLGVDVTLKAVRSGDSVYFLVRYPDKEENRLHKPWVWNEEMGVYRIGPQREDTFTFKWSMAGTKVNLSNFSDQDYRADVWYWKANRTDPAGYADDKLHILSSEEAKKSNAIVSTSGKQRYLLRLGDQGEPAQKIRLLTDYQGDVQDQFLSRTPSGSRADVRARGLWDEGVWTIEFGRKLDTGHDDDVRFDPSSGDAYLFGVSIAGLYAEEIDKAKKHPYGQGRISEPLYLVLK